MTRLLLVSTCAALLLVQSRAAGVQTIAVTGNPGLLRISSAVPGSQPISVTQATTFYTVTTAIAPRIHKITAQLDATMPLGVVLTALLAAPPGATSLGTIALDLTARDMVTNIPRNTTSTQLITYTLTATVAAGVVPLSSRVVTYTIIRAP